MESQDQQKKYEELLAASRKMKRRMLQVLAVLGGIVVLMVSVLLILYFVTLNRTEAEPPRIDFFAPYQGDIFEAEEYLSLDRSVSYFDGAVYRSLTDENEGEFDLAVLFLRDFIDIMTRGDHVAYNAAFTSPAGQAEFSQQMIYEAVIAYEERGVDGGDRLIVYRLEYKIHRNDGTLRSDVGSDGIKPQWAVVRATDDGRISLDSLTLSRP